MLNFDLIKSVLITAVASGIVTTMLVQKIKAHLNTKKYIILISFIVSLIIGTLFSLSFSDLNLIYSVWTGLFSFIDADMLYQLFEDKIFTRFSDMDNVITIERPDDV